MIAVPPPAPHVVRRKRTSIWIGAIITTACVAVGTLAATATLAPLKTPAQVAKAYLEARYAGEWDEAWAMECAMTHSFVGSRSRFARAGSHWDEELRLPRHVVVDVADDVQAAEGLDSIITVTATVSSPERRDWSITGEVPLLVQDDRIQVCDGGLGLNPPPGA